MPEQPMLERLARRLCEIDLRDPDAVVVGEGLATGRTWLSWHAFLADARGILSAMREPTVASLGTLPEGDRADAANRWRALIDAELANCEDVRLDRPVTKTCAV